MKKYFLLFITLILLTSCSSRDISPEAQESSQNTSNNSGTEKKDYYDQLKDDCMRLSEFERGGCNASVNWMKQNSFREALNGSCPSGYTSNMNKVIGSKRWCEQEKFTITKDGSGNTILATPKGEKNICPPGMYPKGLDGCVKDPPKCPDGQTLTGFAGTEFCMMDFGQENSGTGKTLSGTTTLTITREDEARTEKIRDIIKNNTQITGGHDPIPSRHYTEKTHTALMKEVSKSDIRILEFLKNDPNNFVKIGAENALDELTKSGTLNK